MNDSKGMIENAVRLALLKDRLNHASGHVEARNIKAEIERLEKEA